MTLIVNSSDYDPSVIDKQVQSLLAFGDNIPPLNFKVNWYASVLDLEFSKTSLKNIKGYIYAALYKDCMRIGDYLIEWKNLQDMSIDNSGPYSFSEKRKQDVLVIKTSSYKTEAKDGFYARRWQPSKNVSDDTLVFFIPMLNYPPESLIGTYQVFKKADVVRQSSI